MAKIPKVKFPTYEEMAKNVAEKALDDFSYEGKTIREWIQIIGEQDAISREAVLNALNKHWLNGTVARRIVDELSDSINKLPSVQPKKDKWIPISERLPEDGTWNLFTDGKNVSVESYKSDALDHFYPDGRWFSLEEAVAWMPIPEPYREESKVSSDTNMKMKEDFFKAERRRNDKIKTLPFLWV